MVKSDGQNDQKSDGQNQIHSKIGLFFTQQVGFL